MSFEDLIISPLHVPNICWDRPELRAPVREKPALVNDLSVPLEMSTTPTNLISRTDETRERDTVDETPSDDSNIARYIWGGLGVTALTGALVIAAKRYPIFDGLRRLRAFPKPTRTETGGLDPERLARMREVLNRPAPPGRSGTQKPVSGSAPSGSSPHSANTSPKPRPSPQTFITNQEVVARMERFTINIFQRRGRFEKVVHETIAATHPERAESLQRASKDLFGKINGTLETKLREHLESLRIALKESGTATHRAILSGKPALKVAKALEKDPNLANQPEVYRMAVSNLAQMLQDFFKESTFRAIVREITGKIPKGSEIDEVVKIAEKVLKQRVPDLVVGAYRP